MISPFLKRRVNEDWLLITFNEIILLKNLTFLFVISAPGNNPHSIKIWNPLHMPIIFLPYTDSSITAFIIGENLAIAPARK